MTVRATDLTLGILAGGRARRLGGLDKAWLRREGLAQVLRWSDRFRADTSATLVSANRNPGRYGAHGLVVVHDRIEGDIGPLAGLDALASACATPWLLTVPVDLVTVSESLVPTLSAGRGDNGAWAIDEDGAQPLVALWRVAALEAALRRALDAGRTAVHSLQADLHMHPVRFAGARFGNLNTPADLQAAGMEPTND